MLTSSDVLTDASNSMTEPNGFEFTAADFDAHVLKDFEKLMFDDDGFSDVTLELKDGKTLFAHRNILSSRCPRLKDILADSRKKNPQEKRATIPIDTPYPLFQHILRFIYSGELPQEYDDTEALALMKIADEYGLDELKEYCGSQIQTITAQNVFSYLRLAEEHKLDRLQDSCIKYILADFDAVYDRKAFLELPCETLLALTRRANSNSPTPITEFQRPLI